MTIFIQTASGSKSFWKSALDYLGSGGNDNTAGHHSNSRHVPRQGEEVMDDPFGYYDYDDYDQGMDGAGFHDYGEL